MKRPLCGVAGCAAKRTIVFACSAAVYSNPISSLVCSCSFTSENNNAIGQEN